MNIKYPRDSKILHVKNTKKSQIKDAENYKKTTEMQLNLDELQTKVNGLNQTVDAVSQSAHDIDDALAQISTNTAGISTLNQSVSSLQTAIDTNSQNTSNLQSTVDTNSQNITALQTAVGTNTINISALQTGKQDKLTAGANVTIDANNVISATGATYTAGTNVTIDANNVISATGGATYTAGANVTINNGVISATDTTYTAGSGIDITNNVISATGGGGLSSVTASNVDSELATQGQVLTANGQGGATWQTVSGGGGLTQEQETKLNDAYNYYLTHVVEPDPNYNPQTASDYPAGTIFKTFDYYERDILLSSTSAITLEKIYFCAEQGSLSDIRIQTDLESTAGNYDTMISVYVNNIVVSQEVISITEGVKFKYEKDIFNVALNQNAKGNNIYIQFGKTNISSQTLKVTKYRIEIVAPNADIFNKILPYSVEYIDGKYYVTDCSDGNAKLAIIDKNEINNINNLQYENLGFEAQHLDVGCNVEQYGNSYIFGDIIYAYNTNSNKVVYYSPKYNYTNRNSTYTQFDWEFNRSTNTMFAVSLSPSTPKYTQFSSTNSSLSSGSYSTKFNNIVKSSAPKYIQAGIFDYRHERFFTQITQNGEVRLGCMGQTGDSHNLSLGYGTMARIYITNHTANNAYNFMVFINRYGKIYRYNCHMTRLNSGFVIDEISEIGAYDDFMLGANNDYFVYKNHELSYHKFNNN